MNNNLKNLKQEFNKIKNAGYIKSMSKYKNGCGITFEKLLNAGADGLCFPDYKGIEIKVLKNEENVYLELFGDTPTGKYPHPTKWLSDKYGYPDKDLKNKRVFKGCINSTRLTKVGLFYYFKLRIDKDIKKIVLEIYNYKMKKINEDLFWDFDWIKSKLETKLNYLALIDVDKFYSKNIYYYHYEKINFFKLKDFNTFIDLIENGTISILFKTGYYKKGKNIGKFHDHGTTFRIKKEHIDLLFDNVNDVVIYLPPDSF